MKTRMRLILERNRAALLSLRLEITPRVLHFSAFHYYYYWRMCQGGKPDTGKLHSPYISMNVCGLAYDNGVWSMACVLQQRIECYYYYYYWRICVRVVSLTLVSFTHLILV